MRLFERSFFVILCLKQFLCVCLLFCFSVRIHLFDHLQHTCTKCVLESSTERNVHGSEGKGDFLECCSSVYPNTSLILGCLVVYFVQAHAIKSFILFSRRCLMAWRMYTACNRYLFCCLRLHCFARISFNFNFYGRMRIFLSLLLFYFGSSHFVCVFSICSFRSFFLLPSVSSVPYVKPNWVTIPQLVEFEYNAHTLCRKQI